MTSVKHVKRVLRTNKTAYSRVNDTERDMQISSSADFDTKSNVLQNRIQL